MKHAVVTGGNLGLGLECARSLLRLFPDVAVTVTVRSEEKGQETIAALTSQQPSLGERLSFVILELGSLESIRSFKSRLEASGVTAIDALVCNAGLQVVTGLSHTIDGFETTFGVNHLGHFLLIHELMPLLSSHARTILVASGTHDPAQNTGIPPPIWSDPREFAFPKEWDSSLHDGQRAYSTSKLCNVLCAYELERRLKHAGSTVSVLAFDPSMMPGSGLARGYPSVMQFFWNHVLPLIQKVNPFTKWRTMQHSGESLARLSFDEAYAGESGKYYSDLTPTESSVESHDAAHAAALWALSVELTKPSVCI
jgi:NAD(P)-dependent dehydrogenase (short-subunit alcohol dehydrogenase family)